MRLDGQGMTSPTYVVVEMHLGRGSKRRCCVLPVHPNPARDWLCRGGNATITCVPRCERMYDADARGDLPVRRSHRLFITGFAMLLVLSLGTEVFAWGPATHVQIASDLLANLWLLPAGLAALITQYRRQFLYGVVATDTVLAKKLSRVKQVCHRWTTGFGLLEEARSDSTKVFAYGYLAHLAADTVAHNKFLPRQMAVSRSTVTFGHPYWEIRADALVEKSHWMELRKVLQGTYVEPEKMMRARLGETLLSYGTNRVLFKRVNLLTSLRGWRKSVDFWSHLSRYKLDSDVIGAYRAESLDRIAELLKNGHASSIIYEDPNGNAALAQAKAQKRQLRQMKWAGMPHAQIIREAAAGLAPTGPCTPAGIQ